MPYQTGVPCSSPHAWWNPQKHGCWNGTSWHRGFERWRKRTGRSDSSWANRSRAWLPSLPRVTMATSSGWHRQTPVQKTWRTQPRNGPITASVLARPPPRSVRLDDTLGHVRWEQIFRTCSGPTKHFNHTCGKVGTCLWNYSSISFHKDKFDRLKW